MKQIILASASPRRQALLKQLGFKFKTVKSDFVEVLDQSVKPSFLVKKLALGKALKVAARFKNSIVIGADTFIVCDGQIMGKAHNNKQAREMLSKLSGRKHLVFTGLAVVDTTTNWQIVQVAKAKVYFKKLTVKQIEDYLKTGEPLGKAGAYAIQGMGKSLVAKYEGDYEGIVGLPLKKLVKILKDFGCLTKS